MRGVDGRAGLEKGAFSSVIPGLEFRCEVSNIQRIVTVITFKFVFLYLNNFSAGISCAGALLYGRPGRFCLP